MRAPRSLQGRLALWLGAGLMVLWIAAASVTALLARHQMNEVFDSALAATAQRLLPLVVVDIIGREEEGMFCRVCALGAARAMLGRHLRRRSSVDAAAAHHPC